jgi:hypothetical protein
VWLEKLAVQIAWELFEKIKNYSAAHNANLTPLINEYLKHIPGLINWGSYDYSLNLMWSTIIRDVKQRLSKTS